MRQARAYTVTEDWVALNPDVTHAEFRIYVLIKGNLAHGSGGVPSFGFRTTAGWVSRMSKGLISVSTAHRALQGLANKGVLIRRNDPMRGGEGAEFEFVTNPEEYDGPRSIMGEASEIEKEATRSIAFSRVKLDGGPEVPGKKSRKKPASDLKMDEPEPQPEAAAEGAPEFDTSVFGGVATPVEPTGAEAEFAAELEEVTSRSTTAHLRMMAGACKRVAAAARGALEQGWEPRILARRLASELNPRVNMPEKLLLQKVKDIGSPPKASVTAVAPTGDDQLGQYVPPKRFRGRGTLDLNPEEQARVDARLAAHQARRARADRTKS